MKNKKNHFARGLRTGASIITLSLVANMAMAQSSSTADNMESVDEIVVSGIRGSLQRSLDVKRNAKGVVDAISAEDIGKFPDSNLAESLQRITGVSIDRERGEGSKITVRGFGPEFNMVTLNGRQMPTSTLGDGASAPSTRAFDFANLASEAVAATEVYKTGRASIPSGGIGSTVNIKTAKPLEIDGLSATAGFKLVTDDSRIDGDEFTPEFSALVSNSWEDTQYGDFGVALSLVQSERHSGSSEAKIPEWRDAFRVDGGGWGGLSAGANHENFPTDGATVYRVPQNAQYNLINFESERINQQLVMQWRPMESLTATMDWTYSEYEIESRNNDISIWFNHGDTSTQWGDGNPAPIHFYEERFGADQDSSEGASDLSMGAGLTANANENESIGLNLEWEAMPNLMLTFDFHDSSAESKPNAPYGSNNVIGSAAVALHSQKVDLTNEIPVISWTSKRFTHDGQYTDDGVDAQITDATDVRLRQPTGNVYRNAYFRNDLQQWQVSGTYLPDNDMLADYVDSVNFGVGMIENDVRSAFGFIQNETWGGALRSDQTPDSLFTYTTLRDKFSGVGGSHLIPEGYHRFRFEDMANLLFENGINICQNGSQNCLADFTTDRRINEETTALYVEADKEFTLLDRDAYIRVGLRYEETDITSRALVPIPTDRAYWEAANEFKLTYGEQGFTSLTASYDYLLPAIDFDVDIREDIKLRASYSETITRPTYTDLQGGLSVSELFRINEGSGNVGNPALEPFESENLDVTGEWYYGDDTSYVAAGYYKKDVSNWIGGGESTATPFSQVRHPGQGPRAMAAAAALGTSDAVRVRDWIIRNAVDPTGGNTETNEARAITALTGTPTEAQIRTWIATPGNVNPTGYELTDSDNDGSSIDANGQFQANILALPEDPVVVFRFQDRNNLDREQTIDGWEFAWQHDFAETGFGFIANYTIVDGDISYDNTQPSNAPQFALEGLSDSANLSGYYDKDGINARISWNWRDEFLSASGNNPTYTEEYEQIDIALSYEVPTSHTYDQSFTVFLDGVNITEEGKRTHGRHKNYVHFVAPGHARYYAGVRWKY